jgi:hypothetical protein
VSEEQLPLDLPHARVTDPRTSWAAAREIEAEEGKTTTFTPGTNKHRALAALARQPRTAIEVERVSHRRGIWKRVSDLKNAGVVENIGERRDPETGKDGIVWKLNERGWNVLSRLNRGEKVRLKS